MKNTRIPSHSKIGVGFPQISQLEAWARLLHDAFDAMPYLVGSALTGKEWRDVDVRMLLDDDQWRRWFGETHDLHPRRMIASWAVLCTAISEWGERWTGLPIDFQFQTRTEGNEDPYNLDGEGNVKPRSALAIGFIDLAAASGETTP